MNDEPTTGAGLPPTPPLPLERASLLGVSGVTRVTLVRHGQQVAQTGARYDAAASVDPPLSALGLAQAEAVASLLADDDVDVVVTSPLVRAQDTARAIAVRHGLTPGVHRDLREVETFRYLPTVDDGGGPTEVQLAGLRQRFLDKPSWDLYPWSERSAEFRDRVCSTIRGLLELHESARHLVIVCHGGVINAHVADVLGVTTDWLFHPAHTSLSRVRVGEGRHVLDSLNDTRHLAPGQVTY